MTMPSQPYGQQPYGDLPPYGQQPYNYLSLDGPHSGPPPPGYGTPPGRPEIASIRARLLARLIDWALTTAIILAGVAVIAIAAATRNKGGVASGLGLFLGIAVAVTGGLLYEPVLIATRGATVGKRAMGLTVRSEATGALPTAKASIFRYGLPLIASLGMPFGTFLFYVSPLFDRSGRRQGWHDKVAGTVVVTDRVERGTLVRGCRHRPSLMTWRAKATPVASVSVRGLLTAASAIAARVGIDNPIAASRPEPVPPAFSYRDRETAVERVQDAFAAERISAAEMDGYLHAALSATTHGELAPVLTALGARGRAGTTMAARSGRIQRRGAWRVPRFLTVESEFGTVRLDLSHAVIEHRVVDIELRLPYGRATIVMPRNAVVDLDQLRAVWKHPVHKPLRRPCGQRGPLVRISGTMGYGRLRIRHSRR